VDFLMKTPADERKGVLFRLAHAATLLETSMDTRLIPPRGLSIGYAVRGARDSEGIAAIYGGIHENERKACSTGPAEFGVDEQIARIILTTMKFEPGIRSAAVLCYSGTAITALEDMLLECDGFDPARQPADISTMEWGVASCCKDRVPDVIYNKKGGGIGGIIRILGEDPVVVANNILILSNRILHSEL
jgi:thiamine-phosphate diphosphorylase